jgi:hypothetical protein
VLAVYVHDASAQQTIGTGPAVFAVIHRLHVEEAVRRSHLERAFHAFSI